MRSTLNTLTRRRILIVDNHPLVRRGLTGLIDAEPDLSVCAATATGQAAVEAIAESRPDLVITDISLEKEDDGLALVRFIRSKHPNLPVLVLTMHGQLRYTDLAVRAGADGYITKQEETDTLLIAIRRVLQGKQYVHPRSSDDHEIH